MSGNIPLPPIGGPSPVSGGKTPPSRWASLGGAVAVVVVVGVLISVYQSNKTSNKVKEQQQEVNVGTSAAFRPAPSEMIVQQQQQQKQKPPPVTNDVAQRVTGVEEFSLTRVKSGNQQRNVVSPQPVPVVAEKQEDENTGELGRRLQVTVLHGSKSSRIRHPMFTITQGTQIPCNPDAIDSTLPGLIVCHIPINIYGTEPGVVLLDRGTRVTGQIQSGLIQGQRRAFIVWTRAETPTHVIIDLNSPAADIMGRAGLEGDIKTYFLERFGGAIMLSFIDTGLQMAALGASQALSGSGHGGSNNATFNQFQSQGSGVANSALQATINIPPTLSRDQALPSIIFVARDLEFAGNYGLELKR